MVIPHLNFNSDMPAEKNAENISEQGNLLASDSSVNDNTAELFNLHESDVLTDNSFLNAFDDTADV
jgi:hypothetical protein